MANITNTDELVDNIKKLTTPIDLPAGTFNEKMDASEVNALFQGIETCLNSLYEKLRMLEDLHMFSEEYIKNEFNKVKPELDDAIVKLDQAEEDYTSTKAKANLLTFVGGNVITDRDGSSIDSAQIIDGSVILAGSVNILEANPTKVVVGATDIAYRRSKTPVDNYKTFYALESMPSEPIKESVDIFFARPTIINFMRMSAFNSSISNIAIYKSNNDVVNIDPGTMVFPECTATGVHMDLTGGKIEPVVAEITGEKSTFSSLEDEYESNLLSSIFEKHVKDNGGE